jgi:hypothetical protein
MASHRGVEMATRRCSIETLGGASMGRWFWTRGGEIGAGMGAVDNRGALIAHFIGSYSGERQTIKGGRGSGDGTSMMPITGDGNGEGEVIGCIHFQMGRGGGGEAAPQCCKRMTQ